MRYLVQKTDKRRAAVTRCAFTVDFKFWFIGVFAPHPFREVLPRFFKSERGLGRRPITRHFSFVSFSLCALHRQREKRLRSFKMLKNSVAARLFSFHSHFFFWHYKRGRFWQFACKSTAFSRRKIFTYSPLASWKDEKLSKRKRCKGGLCPFPPAFEKAGKTSRKILWISSQFSLSFLQLCETCWKVKQKHRDPLFYCPSLLWKRKEALSKSPFSSFP